MIHCRFFSLHRLIDIYIYTMLLWKRQVYILHIHLINIQHSIYRINHVQSVYIFRYTPAMFGSLFMIYPSGRWPSGNITNKFLTAGVYLTYTPLGHGLYIYIYIYIHGPRDMCLSLVIYV